MPSWLKEAPDHVILRLRVQPGAKRTEVIGAHGDALKVRLAAPPVDGSANAMLISFLAQVFDVPARNVVILTGRTSRDKRVRVDAPRQRPDLTW